MALEGALASEVGRRLLAARGDEVADDPPAALRAALAAWASAENLEARTLADAFVDPVVLAHLRGRWARELRTARSAQSIPSTTYIETFAAPTRSARAAP